LGGVKIGVLKAELGESKLVEDRRATHSEVVTVANIYGATAKDVTRGGATYG